MGIRSLLRNAFGRSRAARKSRTDGGEGTVPETEPADASATPDTAEAGTAAGKTAPADASAAPAESSASESTPDAQAPSPPPLGETGAPPSAASGTTEEKPTAQPEGKTAEAGEASDASDEPSGASEATAPAGEPAEEPADGTSSATAAPTATEPEPTIPAQAGAPEAERTGSPLEKTPESSATPESGPVAGDSTPVSGEATTSGPEDEAAQPEVTEPEVAQSEVAQPEVAEDPPSIPAQRTSGEEGVTARVPAQRTAPPVEPKADAPTAEPAGPTSAGSPGAPAIPLTKIEESAPGLVSLYKKAGAALGADRLGGQRAAVYLVLDRSGSMRRYYKDGTVQHLAEQALALSAHLDDDGIVPVVFFSTDIDGIADVSLEGYEGRIEALHADLGHMGRTNYHRAIEAVIEHYKKSGSTDPAFVIFQTDGAPTSKPAAEKALCEAAKLPIFWQFVGFGDPGAKGFDFLRKLDVLSVPEKRPVDNAGFFHAGLDPLLVADDELFTKVTAEFPAWLESAREAGILR